MRRGGVVRREGLRHAAQVIVGEPEEYLVAVHVGQYKSWAPPMHASGTDATRYDVLANGLPLRILKTNEHAPMTRTGACVVAGFVEDNLAAHETHLQHPVTRVPVERESPRPGVVAACARHIVHEKHRASVEVCHDAPGERITPAAHDRTR